MPPAWSIAIEPIQREVLSGAKVDCWKTFGVPPERRSSYQRIAVADPLATEWVSTIDSWSPKLR